MPASSAEARGRWRKRKREHPAPRKSRLKDTDDEMLDENEDEDDPDLDSSQNQETEDDPNNHNTGRKDHVSQERESEKLLDGGLRISEFPIVIKKAVSRPHSLVSGIVEAERAARSGVSRAQGVPALENISYGQLQSLSAVPRDSSALLGAPTEETASGSGGGSYVITPPRITAGHGIMKRLGTAARVHVLPAHSEWFSPNSVHRLERQVVPHFFSGKSAEHTPELYMECRNFIVAKYMENPEKHLSVNDCQGLVTGISTEDLTRITRFLDHWGIINYCAAPLKHESPKNGAYLCEDSNSELLVPSAALKSIDSLIKFDKPKCKRKAADVYPELAFQQDENSDLDNTIREQLSEHRCCGCSQSITAVCYQSQKEVDVSLCLDCFNEGRFVPGHSSLDFVKVDSLKDFGDVDGDSWSDQETLLLLEGMQLHKENWNKIAEHVGTKSKPQCVLHFLRLPLDGSSLENINCPSTSGSSTVWNHENHERGPNSNGFGLQGSDSESKFPFSDSVNPVMSLVAFISSALGPRVAAACALASLASLNEDNCSEGISRGGTANSSKNGPRSQLDGDTVSISAERVMTAAKDGLAAAAVKAKLFADHEEREIQRLSANIVNHQLKRLELKLKQFAEVETLLMRECEQMERTRLRFSSDRAQMISSPPQFGSPGPSRPMGPPANMMNNNSLGHSRPQMLGSQQPYTFGNNQPIHHQMSGVPQQGMYGLGPRLPLSAINPSSSAPNTLFNPTPSTQSSLGHPMLRPISGTRSGLG